jgi:Cft2 family RNA processing exonuclease
MAMYDAYLAKHYNGEFSLFSPESIDAVWDKLIPLKFSQHLVLEGKAQGLEITPYAAGYSLGGCVWRIKLGMDEIVYCK